MSLTVVTFSWYDMAHTTLRVFDITDPARNQVYVTVWYRLASVAANIYADVKTTNRCIVCENIASGQCK